MKEKPVQRKIKKRKFFLVSSKLAHKASGFRLINSDKLFEGGRGTILPPIGQRGFKNYPEAPLFLADTKLGRIHWDLEEYSGYWFISEKMKAVLERVDPGAFAFLRCDVQSPDGQCSVRWLCDVVRVLDALDESQSTVEVDIATNGNKIYRPVYSAKLIFREDAIGDARVFRMKYFNSAIVGDQEFRLACKSADLNGISFDDPSR